ncbi:sulfide dehydrogenase (flavocytochrome c), flavoprotein subunit [Roseateles sp. YR242]|uniref:NAD(P)/FAD-dependent oxidoreductase n=1 Tax=Roseateles sp. YR242 TaxID=1855305 RepID=UPI0008BD6001|nr:NAD(P)/FAD-dependent oxidoreductase [Roseateles sp. YR242]SEL32111.1 sulfide dehydrogenase (flavocytochrome c), flavoprotein subunit [Roseateles sp. YR242]
MMRRRDWLLGSAAAAAWGTAQAHTGWRAARVVVIGGGIGGATAARYLRLWSGHQLEVVLIEPQAGFVSCPLSNLVLGGFTSIDALSRPLASLEQQHGVRLVRDHVVHIDTARRLVLLAHGDPLRYDRLIVSPGIDLQWDSVQGLQAAHQSGQILQAWKAGPETVSLRRQIEAMPEGGVFAVTIPEAPYRCPPGPYERASVVAAWLKKAKPRAKLLVFDANPDITSKGPLFKKIWAERYAGILEYRPLHKAVAVETGRDPGGSVRFELQPPERADVLNVLPAMRAGTIARTAGLAGETAAGRWCPIHYQTFTSTVAPDVHIIGDAIQVAPAMPKSGHMANAHAKVAAAAVLSALAGQAPDAEPMLTNTCYSHVDGEQVIHVASVHRYLAQERTYRTVPGSGGVSDGPTALEARYAWHWARTLWSDMLA